MYKNAKTILIFGVNALTQLACLELFDPNLIVFRNIDLIFNL
jgi:hypothetical protein